MKNKTKTLMSKLVGSMLLSAGALSASQAYAATSCVAPFADAANPTPAEIAAFQTCVDNGFISTDTRFTSVDTRLTADEAATATALTSVDTRFTSTDTRLGSADTRFVSGDTRFTSADTRLDSADTRFVSGDTRFTSADTRFVSGDTRFDSADTRFVSTDTRFVSGDTRLNSADTRFASGDTRVDSVDTRLDSMVGSMDQVNRDIRDMKREYRAGISAAIALQATSTPSKAGETVVDVGVGQFAGYTSVGVNLGHLFDNGMSVGAGIAHSGSESAGRIGVGFRF